MVLVFVCFCLASSDPRQKKRHGLVMFGDLCFYTYQFQHVSWFAVTHALISMFGLFWMTRFISVGRSSISRLGRLLPAMQFANAVKYWGPGAARRSTSTPVRWPGPGTFEVRTREEFWAYISTIDPAAQQMSRIFASQNQANLICCFELVVTVLTVMCFFLRSGRSIGILLWKVIDLQK